MNTPVKVVRIKLPEGHVDEDESSMSATPENAESDENKPSDINIVMKATITSPGKSKKRPLDSTPNRTNRQGSISPRKRASDSSAVTFRLDEELERASKRRVSEVGVNGLTGGEENMAQIVVSLRRQNDDLRQKLLEAKEINNKTIDNSGMEKEEQLRKLAEKECDELRTTVSRLERLIKIEREERSVSEKQTLDLLEDVKKKWHEREEARVQKVCSVQLTSFLLP